MDGHEYQRRFTRSGDAAAFADELRAGALRRLFFDPAAKRFKSAEEITPSTTDTVFSWTEEYWSNKWASLEPKSRSELARYLNRTRAFFVQPHPNGTDADAVADYLAHASLVVRQPTLTDRQRAGEEWLERHSLPLDMVDRTKVSAFLAHYRKTHRDPDRQISPATERRMVADLKQCWRRAVVEGRLASSPWDMVVPRTRTTRGSARSTEIAADAEMVLAPEQVLELADRCVTEGSWGGHVRAFVLVMGFCGLRPNEAVGLLVGDVDLNEGATAWLTVRRNRRRVAERFLDPEEDRDWGPLKGRDLAAVRRVPIPSSIVPYINDHLTSFCTAAAPTDLVFEHRGKPFDLSEFSVDVWHPARESMFPPVDGLDPDSPLQPKLSRLRRHDLRHSACSTWLRANVDVSVCQLWSGHKRLSVFLDIYQGLIPGRQEEGVKQLEDHLAAVL